MSTSSVIPLPGFCAGTFQARSPISQAEDCINLYPESNGSGTGRATLYAVPGLKLYVTLPTGPVQCLLETNFRTFAVSGGTFYEIYSTPDPVTGLLYLAYGSVGACDGDWDSDDAVSMATNGSPATTVNTTTGGQVVIVSSNAGYVFDLTSNTLAPIISPGFPTACTNVTIIDGYFVVGDLGSRQFNISNVDDGTTWVDSTGIPMYATKEGNSDNIQAVLATRRTLVIFGFETTEVWWDSGGVFPFTPIQGALLQQGLASPQAISVMDDSVYWLGSDARGNAQVWGQQNLSPVRISNNAIEHIISQFESIDDCVSEVYQEEGHVFLLLHFPNANWTETNGGGVWDSITLAYDKTTGQWHKRGWWDAPNNVYHAAIARTHCFAFVPQLNIDIDDAPAGSITDGVHLVGDYRNGNLYLQSLNYYDDSGTPKRWLRRAPNVINLNQRNAFYRAELLAQCGTVPQVPLPGSNPIVSLRYSDDGGFTWSNDKPAYVGLAGKYKNRVIWRQLGSGRDRVFEITGSDPIAWALVEFYIRISPGDA